MHCHGMCYPGDPAHPVRTRALPDPLPTRLVWRGKRLEPPPGFAAWLD